MNNTNKRTFLNLDYVQGEEIELEFYIVQDCKQLHLDEYNFVGSVLEDFNDVPVANFTFAESELDSKSWIANIPSSVTTTLVPQVYKYEIRMEHKTNGKPDTILYGTLNIRPTRLAA